jgi:hypothetical protein
MLPLEIAEKLVASMPSRHYAVIDAYKLLNNIFIV